jgi:FkbH-like protein
MKNSSTEPASLAAALRKNRRSVSEAFAQSACLAPRWKAAAERATGDWPAFVELEFGAFADYLARYYDTGDEVFRTLLLGEKIKLLYDPALEQGERRALADRMAAAEASAIGLVLHGLLDESCVRRVQEDLRAMGAVLSASPKTEMHVLLVGDCLFLDIVPFAVAELLEQGIALIPDYASAKGSVQLREELRGHARAAFDLVFYSPFTYEFSPPFAALTRWQNAAATARTITAAAGDAWRAAESILDHLADTFDCPIYVHNTSALLRESGGLKRAVKQRLTARARCLARQTVNTLLEKRVAAKNSASYKHLFVLDEASLVADVGETEAGRYLHWTPLQHPAVLGSLLAKRYVDILIVEALLAKRKVIVSDLDNTLWHGVIGEGSIEHDHARQKLLKALKDRGVVLAINSKNDPANVHWRGGTLQDTDFVFSAISWEPKVRGMRRIQDGLNVKTKDFVFIDDREDELALMKAAHAEVVCLNATDPSTWTRLALWCERLDEHPDMDRTLMYRQREERKAFERDVDISDEERRSLFAELQLSVDIEEAASAGLKRFAELINRTNQFNLEGSRVTYQEVCGWHASKSHLLLSAKSADRFGEMGTTCVAAARVEGAELVLLAFVLSCRVFGYGIEIAVLNELKAFAARRGLVRIIGRYVPTLQNAPCKDFLAHNGFVLNEGRWLFAIGSSEQVDPPWLRVLKRVPRQTA